MTKVCFSCGVQSQTAADRCPACGTRYGRRRRVWLWLLLGVALLIVLLIYGATQTLMAGDEAQAQKPAASAYVVVAAQLLADVGDDGSTAAATFLT